MKLFNALTVPQSVSSILSEHCPLLPLPSLAVQPNYDQSEMGMTGLGYDRAQFTSGHAPPHGMLRQKSIGEAVSLSVWPALWPACPSVCPLDS